MRDFHHRTTRLFLSACFLLLCTPLPAAVPVPGQILVRCSEGVSGLRGLSVLLDEADIASTDAQGLATISAVPGVHVLAIRRGDRPLGETRFELDPHQAGELLLDLAQGAANAVLRFEAFDVRHPGEGLIAGTITGEDGEALAAARIGLGGADVRASADDNGRFQLRAPRGNWELSVSHPKKPLTRSFPVRGVSPNRPAELQIVLAERRAAPTGTGIEEVVATARYVPDTSSALEQSSDTVLDAISEQEIAIAGDSDAAAALTRVTGVTLVNDLVFVRGLGDRYSATYVNRGEVPSPDPSRRAIGLDIFPTDILAGIRVQKTYTQDLPGDFSGGAVLLDTSRIPDEFELSLGVSTGGNSRSTGHQGLSYAGGDTDWLGLDDGLRDIPDLASGLTDHGRIPLSQLAPEDNRLNDMLVEQVGDSLRPIFDVEAQTLRPDIGLEFAVGDRHAGWDVAELGYQFTLLYDRKARFRDEDRTNLGPTGDIRGVALRHEQRERSVDGIDTGGIATLSARFDEEQELRYTGILSRQTTQGTFFSDSVTTAAASSDNINDRAYTLDWIENQLLSHQFGGLHRLHRLSDLKLEWQVTTAKAASDTLDRREYRYRRTAGSEDPFGLVTAGSNPRRSWEFLDDATEDAGLGLSLPLSLPFGVEAELEAGLRRTDRARSFDKVSWVYQLFNVPDDVAASLQLPSLEQVLDPRFIRPDAWQLSNGVTQVPGASNADSYRASQDLSAFYFGSSFAFGSVAELKLGARRETSRIEVGLTGADAGAEGTSAELDTQDWLPAANLSWFLDEHRTLRAGYSRTVNRPQFREIAPIPYRDPETRDQSFGRLDLQQAELKNYDLRYEHYWNASEGVTVAAFWKDLLRPIEQVVGSNNGEPSVTFSNARSAEVYGLELDGRWELDEFAKRSETLGYTYLSGNLSLFESSVKLDPAPDFCVPPVSVGERQLQGQSPWIVNLTLGYANPLSETDLAVLFNMFGERLVGVGQLQGCAGLPDAEEQPAGVLDLNLRQRLYQRWKLGLKLRNLLDPEIEVVQGGTTTRAYRNGRVASLSVEYEF